jgi:nifR3 family TIM-barrel protein
VLKVGPLQLATPLLLAPIAGYCDLAFRQVCREQGGLGLACTDLLSPQGLLRGTATSLDLAMTNDLDRPVGMQLYGSDPAIMADGARWARDHGASLVDINMGCPVDKVTKKDGGSKLLCDPGKAERIVEAVVSAVGHTVPVTAKLRLGWFDREPVAKWLAPQLVKAGAAMITIHGRTTQQKFTGVVNHDGIREVVEAVKAVSPATPVIGNGDVTEPEHALLMIERTGCDGVMIGRGALSTPWIFRDAAALLRGDVQPNPPTRDEVLAIVKRYFDLMLHYRDERYAMYQIRRRVSWFAKRLPPSKRWREAIRTAAGPDAVYDAIARFDEIAARSLLDERHGAPSHQEGRSANDNASALEEAEAA